MKSKKVFVVKNFKSPYIEEAIFILREDVPPSDTVLPDAVSEAERIIAGYLNGLDCPQPPKRKKSGGKIIAACIGIVSFLVMVCILL